MPTSAQPAAEVEPELLLDADAPDLSACTEVLLLAEELACAPLRIYRGTGHH